MHLLKFRPSHLPKSGEWKASMSVPLFASRKLHTCCLLMASIEKKAAPERVRECVRESVCEREEERDDTERKNVSNRLFLFSSSFSACTFTSVVMWHSGSLCRCSFQRFSTEHAQTVSHFLLYAWAYEINISNIVSMLVISFPWSLLAFDVIWAIIITRVGGHLNVSEKVTVKVLNASQWWLCTKPLALYPFSWTWKSSVCKWSCNRGSKLLHEAPDCLSIFTGDSRENVTRPWHVVQSD